MRSGQVDPFISSLKGASDKWLPIIAQDSYRLSGGAYIVNADIAKFAADFVNAYASGFAEDLWAGKLTPAQIERRALMYPEEGFRLAVINAQRQAMKERGSRRWRRILHPELSKAGPCQQCTADAEITHEIDDEFVEFHPNGVCSQQFLEYTVGEQGIVIEVPVPSDELDRSRRFRRE